MSDYDKANIRRIIMGHGDWFTAQLIRLCAKADPENLERLRMGFPEVVSAYEHAFNENTDENKKINDAIKYLSNGRIVRIISHVAPGRIIVERGFINDDDPNAGPWFEGVEEVDAVYDNPPIEAISREVAALEDKKATMLGVISDLAAKERDAKKRVEALKVYDQLARVEDFLTGKITHYVTYNSYDHSRPAPIISTPEDEKCGNSTDRYAKLKLLVLYGDKERGLEWKLNYYSDGSGNTSTICFPCCSLDEAKQKAREILAGSFAKYKIPDCGGFQTGINLVKSAKACGATIPEGFEEGLKAAEIRCLQEEIKRHNEERVKLQNNLDSLIAEGKNP